MEAVLRRALRLLLVLALALVLGLVLLSEVVDARKAAWRLTGGGGGAVVGGGPGQGVGVVGAPVDEWEAVAHRVSYGAWRLPIQAGVEPGPEVRATSGEPWPQVQRREKYGGFLVLRPSAFKFKATMSDCDLLQDAFKRYHRVLVQTVRPSPARRAHAHAHAHARAAAEATASATPEAANFETNSATAGHTYKPWRKQTRFRGYLDTLEVQLLAPCEKMPHLAMDEHYELRVDSTDIPGAAVLRSRSIWGALRGLETFSQLVKPDSSGTAFIINSTAIEDFPRFPHRGLLLDTSRHFLPLSTIMQTLSAMEVNKMNVFHWHIVDDQSFPYQSNVFPALSEKGAYDPANMIYTRDDIKAVIEFARQRGIRVIPEFDTPGHTRSWGEGLPEILTACYIGDEPDGTYGPINPIHSKTYQILKKFFKEVVELFADQYIHLGGDEVSFDCWASNPNIISYMESKNISGEFTVLESMYIQKLVDITTQLNASSVVWQEVFDNGVHIPQDTVVHVWLGNQATELSKVTQAGHRALLSTCWYLDHLETGGDWQKYYDCDPHDFIGSDEQKELVMGGEACMWGEVVDETNIHSRIWPRASAAAEKLWSARSGQNTKEVAQRLEEHTCRMKRRGIPAQPPNGPGFCPL